MQANLNNIIGRFHGMNVPVTVDDRTLYQHLLVCGATGSGKSNTMANLVKAASAYGFCVIIFDHKPDYQDVDKENDEKDDRLWKKFNKLGLKPMAFDKASISYYTLWGQERREAKDEEVPLAVRASDVDEEMLAATIFPSPSDDNQRFMFLALLRAYKDARKENATFTLYDLTEWIGQYAGSEQEDEDDDSEENPPQPRSKAKKSKDKKRGRYVPLSKMLGFPVSDATMDAMLRKIATRRPLWLDALDKRAPKSRKPVEGQQMSMLAELGATASVEKPSAATQAGTQYFDPTIHLAKSKIVVIRVAAEGREYGLFLSYVLKRVNSLLSKNKLGFPVVNFIDEAHDIFQGEKAVAEAATKTVMRAVNKGRSLRNAFVFSTQNPSQLPAPILNNLNSRIIHRQNEESQLRLGIPGAPPALMKSCLSFGPGEALVYILGSRATVRAEMAPSPFMLTKLIGKDARRFMAEDLIEEEE